MNSSMNSERMSEASLSANPFVGPRPFDQEDAAAGRYHGREREARDLLALVTRERLVLFYSQSGAGKSSLLRASLVPALHELGFDVLPIARVSGAQPPSTANPFLYNLILSLNAGLPPEQQAGAETLATERAGGLAPMNLAAYLGGAPAGAAVTEAAAAGAPGIAPGAPPGAAGEDLAPTVLLIDQFEEIITAYPNRWEERRAFFEQLRDAMQQLPRLWVVLTLREEYVGPLEPYAELMPNRLRARYYMQRMGVEAALEAISKPAAAFGRPFAPGVAETLVDNLRRVRSPEGRSELGQYVEPVQLQVVCHRLWQQVTQGAGAPLAAPPAMPAGATAGAARGAAANPASPPAITAADLSLDSIDQALTWFYRDALAGSLAAAAVIAAGVDESELRRWFDREAITPGGIRNSVLRDEQSGRTGSLPNAAVDALLRRYILRADLRAGAAWVELVHDRFVEPIREDNAAWFPQHMHASQRQALLWRDAGRRPGLLLEGKLLAEAAQWAAAHPGALEPVDKEFLAACEREAASRRRARWFALAALAVGVLVLVGLLALQTYLRQVEAQRQRDALEAQLRITEVEAQRADALALAKRKAEEAAENARQQNLALNVQTQSARQAARAARAAEQRALDLAAVAQSRQLAAESTRLLGAGDVESALLAAVEGYTITHTAEAGSALALAVAAPQTPQRVLFAGDPGNVYVYWNGSGSRILASEAHYNTDVPFADRFWEGDTLRVIDPNDGKILLTTHPVQTWWWNGAKTQLLTAAPAQGIQLWDWESGVLLRQFGSESQGVSLLNWSKNGQRVLAAAGDGAAYIWELATGAPLVKLERPGDAMQRVRWNPEETRVLSWTESGVVQIWDAEDGRAIRQLGGAGASTLAPRWSPAGEWVATVDEEGTATIWDAATGARLQDLPGEPGAVIDAGWGDSRRYVLTLADDRMLRVWETETGKEVLQLPNTAFLEGPDRDDHLLAKDLGGDATLWDLASGEAVLRLRDVDVLALNPGEDRFLAQTASAVRVYAYPSAQLLAAIDLMADSLLAAGGLMDVQWLEGTSNIVTYHFDGSLRLWDSDSGEVRAESSAALQFSDTFYASNSALSPDGNRLVSAFADGVVRLWDDLLAQRLADLPDVESASWVNDDQVLARAAGGAVSLWSAGGVQQTQIDTGAQDLQAVWLAGGDQYILSHSSDGVLQGWEVASGERRLQAENVAEVCSTWHGGQETARVAAITGDGVLHVWGLSGGQEEHVFPAGVIGCAWDRSGSKLAAWTSDKSLFRGGATRPLSLRVWDVADGAEIATLEAGADYFNPLFGPDSSRLLLSSLSPSSSWQTTLWDVERGAELARAYGSAQWSADGARVLVTSDEGAVLWDAADGRTLHTWPQARVARWGLDDTVVAGSTAGGDILLWDTATGAQRPALPGHTLRQTDGYAFRFQWSADHGRILTGDAINMLRVWDAASGALLDEFPSPFGGYTLLELDPTGGRVLIRSDNGAVLRAVDARRDLLRLDDVREAWPDTNWGRLLVTNRDGSVQIIPTDGGELAAAACARVSRNLQWSEWQRLLPGVAYRPTCSGALIAPDVVEGIRREAAALLAAGDEAAARRRVDDLNGWLAQSGQVGQLGLDFARLDEP